ncbi:MAG: TetR/AcrR family transcriptional regulator [Bacteroidia bacterium]|jgi:AcrR family transcriptional regulator|nr:TetR/AcrR family transcriptional regulator [Bacteroidia bacterium]
MNPSRSRKDEIVALSESLIRTQGCNAFSYYDLAEALRLRPAAIHYHFPHKDDLLTAVAVSAGEGFKQTVAEIEQQYASPAGQLRAFIRRMYQEPAGEGKLCIVLALGSDFNSLPPACSEALRKTSTAILEWLATVLAAGREQRSFSFNGTPRSRAQLVLSSLSASLPLSRLYGKRIFTEIQQQLLNDIMVQPPAKSRAASPKK